MTDHEEFEQELTDEDIEYNRQVDDYNIQMYGTAQADLDRAVFQVASVALVFSAGFMLISEPFSQNAMCFLFIAWSFFVGSLCTQLGCAPVSISAFEEDDKSRLNNVITALNNASIVFTMLGLICLQVFAGFVLLSGAQ